MNTLQKSSTNNKIVIVLISLLVLVVLLIISVCVGAVNMSLTELWCALWGTGTSNSQIIQLVRLPRSFAACIAGISLALSGTILQTVLNNPMCSPSIIGVNAGAGFFMIVTTAFFPSSILFSPISAFIGALVAVLIVNTLAKKTGASKLAVVLSGIAVSSVISALTDTIVTLVPDAKIARIDFMIGSFSGVTIDNVIFALPYVIIAVVVAFALCVDINVLALGDSTASSLGLRVSVVRGVLLIVAALLAGSAISLGGLIGFVGLIVPHIAKLLIGHDHKYLLPLSAILGGTFCLLCDILARVLFAPFELPVGIIMSLIGAPFFIWLILTRKRRIIFD